MRLILNSSSGHLSVHGLSGCAQCVAFRGVLCRGRDFPVAYARSLGGFSLWGEGGAHEGEAEA